MSGPVAIVPVSILRDHRLSLIQTRVLLALQSYWDCSRPHSPVSPTVRELSARCGYTPRTIIRATTALCDLGYLKRLSGQGHQSTRYWFLDPDVPEARASEAAELLGGQK